MLNKSDSKFNKEEMKELSQLILEISLLKWFNIVEITTYKFILFLYTLSYFTLKIAFWYRVGKDY